MLSELKDGKPTYYAKTAREWRNWLKKNGENEKSVWLIIYKKETGVPSVYYSEAVDEALCYGWIDSKANKRDDQSYYQSFARRNPKSKWSRVNKVKVASLIKEGRMEKQGLAVIELAKKNGSWTALDEVEKLIIPKDLADGLSKNKKAGDFFSAFPKSAKRGILEWIISAKKEETRKKRVDETISLAAKNERANQYVKK